VDESQVAWPEFLSKYLDGWNYVGRMQNVTMLEHVGVLLAMHLCMCKVVWGSLLNMRFREEKKIGWLDYREYMQSIPSMKTEFDLVCRLMLKVDTRIQSLVSLKKTYVQMIRDHFQFMIKHIKMVGTGWSQIQTELSNEDVDAIRKELQTGVSCAQVELADLMR